jgi:hypothetical protein
VRTWIPAPTATAGDHPLARPEAESSAVFPLGAGRGAGLLGATASNQQRIGPQQNEEHDASCGVGEAGKHERPGEGGNADGLSEAAGGGDHVGSDDCADGGVHQHRAHRAAPAGGGGEVGSRVASLQVRSRSGAIDEQRNKEQPDVVRGCRDHDSNAAKGSCRVAGTETGAATQTLAHPSDADGRSSRANREQGAGHAGEAAGVQHVLGKESTDG